MLYISKLTTYLNKVHCRSLTQILSMKWMWNGVCMVFEIHANKQILWQETCTCTWYLQMYIDNKFDVSWIYKKGIHAEVYITRAFTCKYKQHFFNKQYTKDLFYEIKMVRKFIYIECYDWIIYLVIPISKEKNNATNSLRHKLI